MVMFSAIRSAAFAVGLYWTVEFRFAVIFGFDDCGTGDRLMRAEFGPVSTLARHEKPG
jgi:hypothetical protein